MSKPNFFIVGAPKCGTTALSEYLREHPNVFMCRPKEPFYFATDFPLYASMCAKSEKEYLALFEGASTSQYAVGEASAIYLYSKEAISNLYKKFPDAKIIVMLRNPVDLVYSMHSQLLFDKDEEVACFRKAWDLIGQRKKGVKIPKRCRDRKMLYYDEVAKLGEQLERLISIYPKEHIHIIFSEEFFKNTGAVYRNVLRFLDLSDVDRKEFQKFNQNKYNKIGWLGSITQRPSRKLVRIAMGIKKSLGIEKLGVLDALRKLNVKKIRRQPLTDDFKIQIIQAYHDDIVKLSQLTGRNLEHWER